MSNEYKQSLVYLNLSKTIMEQVRDATDDPEVMELTAENRAEILKLIKSVITDFTELERASLDNMSETVLEGKTVLPEQLKVYETVLEIRTIALDLVHKAVK